MAKPRIIIADTDISYIIPLQLKFVEEFFEKIDIEIITDKDYYEQLFSAPQKADILIVSEELYDSSLQRHNIGNIFLMTEQYEDDKTGDLNVNRIFKYTSIKEILNEIIGKSSEALKISAGTKKDTQIILVYSACGGVGKTTVALGISACLTKNYKRVLYINASRLQSFQRMLDNKSFITASDVYAKLVNPSENIYNDIKHVIRQELFSYLPPFKAALMSLGLKYSVYEKIAVGAKKSTDYDYIIIDADSSFDEEEAKLIFGDSFNKEFPKEGNSSFEYNSKNNKYVATEVEFDQEEDSFLLDNITKIDKGYEVEIIEYLEDYSEEESVIVKNTNNEEIGRVSISESETAMQDIVKNNKDRFTKKKVYLVLENDNLNLQKVEGM